MVCCEGVSPSQLDKYSAVLDILQYSTYLCRCRTYSQVPSRPRFAEKAFQPRVTHAPQ